MFTGIIEETGRIEAIRPTADGIEFAVNARDAAGHATPGESVAINGICHTVERVDNDRMWFTAVGETIKRTTLGSLRPRSEVNVECAATPSTSLSGHIVQGHVDGVGTVKSFGRVGDDRLLEIRLPGNVALLAVSKGSIAVDGVSLTIIESCQGGIITMTIIPYTAEHTIVKHYRRGTRVNIEADILGKYVMEYLERLGLAARRDDKRMKGCN